MTLAEKEQNSTTWNSKFNAKIKSQERDRIRGENVDKTQKTLKVKKQACICDLFRENRLFIFLLFSKWPNSGCYFTQPQKAKLQVARSVQFRYSRVKFQQLQKIVEIETSCLRFSWFLIFKTNRTNLILFYF